MVDFKRALEAKKLIINCDGYVNCTESCENEATCYFEFTEDNEDGAAGSHSFCESCMRKLFPRASDEAIEDSKRDMFGYKYRKLKTNKR